MNEILNESIITMINQGMISVERIADLIDIKEFIDRVASKNYMDPAAVEELEKKFGVPPTVVSWGDYFQSEMASSMMNLSDDEFKMAVNTVKYDMVSSHLIFSEKGDDFMNWVDDMHAELTAVTKDGYTADEEEILHLKILKDYYLNLELVDNFPESILDWYNTFKDAMAI